MKAGVIFTDPFNKRANFFAYLAIISGLLLFVFFGFSGEALGYYAKLLSMIGIRGWPKLRRSHSIADPPDTLNLRANHNEDQCVGA